MLLLRSNGKYNVWSLSASCSLPSLDVIVNIFDAMTVWHTVFMLSLFKIDSWLLGFQTKKIIVFAFVRHWSYSLINMMQDRNYSVQVVYSLLCGSVSVNKTIESRSRSLYYFVFVDDKQIHIPLCCLLNPTSSLRMNMTSCKIDHNLSPLCTLTKASLWKQTRATKHSFICNDSKHTSTWELKTFDYYCCRDIAP